jgi:catechol 2,3-dioxygenase-like lactoylglutathione lyase family enzyme
MIRHFDHVTIAVRDLARAKAFFALLGFEEDKEVVIKGPIFSDYMGVAGISADHVTLVLPGSTPRLEVQILHYLEPEAADDPGISNLGRIGFNHICFACDDLDGLLARVEAGGFRRRNEVLDFHSRRLVFLEGPEGVTIELAEWH